MIVYGGRGEIRTHGGLSSSPVFKTGAFNRSATLPFESDLIQAPNYKELLICPSKCLAIARLDVNPGDSKPYKL